ncbi:unnamed protein product [Ascophyllum nodosum]
MAVATARSSCQEQETSLWITDRIGQALCVSIPRCLPCVRCVKITLDRTGGKRRRLARKTEVSSGGFQDRLLCRTAHRETQTMAAAMAYLAASPSAPAAVVARLTAALISVRGGGPTDNAPWEDRPYTYEHPPQPPMGVVVGAGVVGAVTGHIVFRSLLVSVGLGIGAMGLAATSDSRFGELARASGRVAVAAVHRTAELNDRYHLTAKVADGTRTAAHRIRKFDQEHAVVHRATEGVKQVWRGLKEYDRKHGISTKAGNALGLGLDKITEALSPPAPDTTSTDPGLSQAPRGSGNYPRYESPRRETRRGRETGGDFGRGQDRSGRGRRSTGSADRGRRNDAAKDEAKPGVPSAEESYLWGKWGWWSAPPGRDKGYGKGVVDEDW